eukprot:5889966-Karenia_brevis.AAC.1
MLQRVTAAELSNEYPTRPQKRLRANEDNAALDDLDVELLDEAFSKYEICESFYNEQAVSED